MSDLVIPEDLRHQHSIATVAYSVQCYTGREVVSLIERIAALEAENGRLKSALATSIAQTAEWNAQANQLTVANNEKAGEIRRLMAALNAAAMSLETIHEQAGRDIYLKHMDQVRGYARSRSLVARAALAEKEPK